MIYETAVLVLGSIFISLIRQSKKVCKNLDGQICRQQFLCQTPSKSVDDLQNTLKHLRTLRLPDAYKLKAQLLMDSGV